MKNKNTTNKKIYEIKYCANILLKISNRKKYIDLFYKHINNKKDTMEYINKMDTLINEANVTDDELYNANNILKELFLTDKYTLHKVQELINSAIQNKPIEINVKIHDQTSKNCNYNSKKISISNNSNKTSYYKRIYYKEILVPIRN